MAETPLSDGTVYRARPTLRIDTQSYPMVTELMLSLEMTETLGGLSSLEARFSNVASDPQGGAAFAFEDDSILKLGAAIAVYGGDENAPQEIFRGTITALEADFPEGGPPELVVLAEDALQKARIKRRSKTHDNATIKKLATDIAGVCGLTAVVTGLSDNLGTLVQLDESDLAFFRRILRRYDADLQAVGEELHVSPRGDVQRSAVELQLYSQLYRASVIADLAHQATAVTTAGWDPSKGKRVTGRSTGAHPGPGSGRKGAGILPHALDQRPHHIAHLASLTAEEAQAIADAAFDDRARRFVCVEGEAEGNPALRVGTHVRLTGLGPRFSNTYFVTRACHRFDLMDGYRTDFTGECAYIGS